LKALKKSNKINEFIENYHGQRDLYHLVKIFSSEMLKNNTSTDPNKALKKSLLWNLSGLEIEIEKEKLFKICSWYVI
jgi:hypothetical protein